MSYPPISEVTPWLPGVRRAPARYHGGAQDIPGGVVLHCPGSARSPVPYLRAPGDGRQVSYHLVLTPPLEWVQLVPLDHRAYHAGRWGNDWVGVCLPGPCTRDRTAAELEAVRAGFDALQRALGGYLGRWCRHSDDPRGHRRDPGPGFDERFVAVLAEAGMRWGLPG